MNGMLEKLMENEEFLKRLAECQTPGELVKVLSENNVGLEEGMTPEEAFKAVKEHRNDELDEEALENVSGGFITVGTALAATGALILAGAALAFIGGYAYQKYRNGTLRW